MLKFRLGTKFLLALLLVSSSITCATLWMVRRSVGVQLHKEIADDLLNAVQEEFKENEDLPNTTNPDDWARISGTKGEKIVNIRTLVGSKTPKLRPIEDITPGQYL